MTLPQPDDGLLIRFLVELLKTPSPTGFTDEAAALVTRTLKSMPGLSVSALPKGGVMAVLNGESDLAPRAMTAHFDTLGAMVKTIKPNGRLTLSQVGGIPGTAWKARAAPCLPGRGNASAVRC